MRVDCSFVAGAALAAFAVHSASATVSLEVKAFTNMQVPGAAPGVVFLDVGRPVVNEAGQVAFRATFGDPFDETRTAAIFRQEPSGNLTAVVLDSGPVPGFPPGEVFDQLYSLFLGDAGEVVFDASTSDPGNVYASGEGIWRWRDETGLELVVRRGDAIADPAGEATLARLYWIAGLLPDGAIGFSGRLNVPGGPASAWANFVTRPDGIEVFARSGLPVPGVPGAVFTTVEEAFGNALGQWFFRSYFEVPGGEQEVASFRWDPVAGLSMLVRSGDPAPGTPPGVVFDQPFPIPSAGGSLLYQTTLQGPGVDFAGALYATDAAGSLVLIGRSGGAAPGMEPGTIFQTENYVADGIAINAAGRVAFSARVAGPGTTPITEWFVSHGIWLFDPATGAVTARVRPGDPAPELPGLSIAGVGWTPYLNDHGDLAFEAILAGPGVTPDNDEAIFAFLGGAVPVKVMREGDLVAFGPGDLRPLLGPWLHSGVPSEQPGTNLLSESRQLTFSAGTTDPLFTSASVAVVATIPEPGLASGLASGIVLLAWLGRRSRAGAR